MTSTTGTASVAHAMNDRRVLDQGDDAVGRSDASAGMDQGLRVLSYLISGVLLYGGLGWVGDHFLGTEFLLPVGIVAGAAFGVYVIIRRFGLVDDVPAQKSKSPTRVANGRPVTETTEGTP